MKNDNLTMKRLGLSLCMAVAALVMAACDGNLFEVENRGAILDADLDEITAIGPMVVGMSADFSNGYDNLTFATAILSDEIVGSGSYFSTGRYRRGLFDSEDADGFWSAVHEARWVAEAGLLRMNSIDDYQFEGNATTARAYLFAGLSNRWLGENFCTAVFSQPYADGVSGPGGESDTGDPLDYKTAFSRGAAALGEAVRHGAAAGATDIVTAAEGVLAQVHMGLGNWDQAAAHAARVPINFVFAAAYSPNSSRETSQLWNETHGRQEVSAWMTLAGTVGEGDPRTPWTDCSASGARCANKNGADGRTIHYRQEKYPTRDDDIPVVKGTEMRLIEAEAALRGGDLAGAMAKINEVRAHFELDALEATEIGSITGGDGGGAHPTSMTGWDILDRERHLTLWLEGRRLWDLRRWDHPHLDGGGVGGYEATVARRASCMPISDEECQVNEKVKDLCFSI